MQLEGIHVPEDCQGKRNQLSENRDFACFNAGLVSQNQEQLFFKGRFRRSQCKLSIFPEPPDLAHYFDDQSVLVFDTRKYFGLNTEHIIDSTPKPMFPTPYTSMDSYALRSVLIGAVANAQE